MFLSFSIALIFCCNCAFCVFAFVLCSCAICKSALSWKEVLINFYCDKFNPLFEFNTFSRSKFSSLFSVSVCCKLSLSFVTSKRYCSALQSISFLRFTCCFESASSSMDEIKFSFNYGTNNLATHSNFFAHLFSSEVVPALVLGFCILAVNKGVWLTLSFYLIWPGYRATLYNFVHLLYHTISIQKTLSLTFVQSVLAVLSSSSSRLTSFRCSSVWVAKFSVKLWRSFCWSSNSV